MTPQPTGRVYRHAGGSYDLIVTREFITDADNLWASLTEPEQTALWFGPWRGEAGPGRTVQIQMGFEEGAPWADLRIVACLPPQHLAASMKGDDGDWRIDLNLTEHDDSTTLELVHHEVNPAEVGNLGPGWEYYLGLLATARAGLPRPAFEDYYPGQSQHYLDSRDALDS